MVVPDAESHLRALHSFFLDFGRVSGLQLNISKTVLVPLYRSVENEVRTAVSHIAPDWGGVNIAGAAKYLGFYVGPDKSDTSWSSPIKKYKDRAKQWGTLGFGMLLTLQAYQVYVSSVLQFIAQLEPLPYNFEDIERGAVRSLLPGPTAWMLPGCLKDATHMHFPTALVDLVAVAQAAKVRVARFENVLHGGLDIHGRARRLLDSRGDNCSLPHLDWCNKWGQHSFLFNLRTADEEFSRRIASSPRDAIDITRRDGFQKRITPMFKSIFVGSSIVHIRRRTDRWTCMTTLPGHRPDRVRRVMAVLQRKATPRMQAAYLRTICNGWCTSHRFQGRGSCLFGCRLGQDKLEHYVSCNVVAQLFASGLELHGPFSFDSFLCMHDEQEDIIKARVAGIYALYRLYNGLRYSRFSPQELHGAFKRYTIEGLR